MPCVEVCRQFAKDKALSQQVDNEVQQLCTRFELTGRSADRTALPHCLTGLAGRIDQCRGGITMKLVADGRETAIQHAGDGSLAQPLQLADLDCNALLDAEFLVGHGHTPYRIGWVWHSVLPPPGLEI